MINRRACRFHTEEINDSHGGAKIPKPEHRGQGRSWLHHAVRRSDANTIKLLVSRGADINLGDDWGRTPLHWAVQGNSVEVVTTLVQCGANVDVQDRGGKTPLHSAGQSGKSEMAEVLIASKANMDIQDGWLSTPLHWAALNGHSDTLEALADGNANLAATNNSGWTALHYAADLGNVVMVRVLMEAKAPLDQGDAWGMTPLEAAVCSSQTEVMDLLVAFNCNIDAQDDNGATALHYAVHMKDSESLHVLVALGANITLKDRAGRTPRQLAIDIGHAELTPELTPGGLQENIRDERVERVRGVTRAQQLGMIEMLRARHGRCSAIMTERYRRTSTSGSSSHMQLMMEEFEELEKGRMAGRDSMDSESTISTSLSDFTSSTSMSLWTPGSTFLKSKSELEPTKEEEGLALPVKILGSSSRGLNSKEASDFHTWKLSGRVSGQSKQERPSKLAALLVHSDDHHASVEMPSTRYSVNGSTSLLCNVSRSLNDKEASIDMGSVALRTLSMKLVDTQAKTLPRMSLSRNL